MVKDAANYTDTLPEQDMETLETSFHQAITLGQNQVTKIIEESLIMQSNDSKSSTEEPSPISTSSPWPSVTTLLFRKSEASVVTTYAPKTTIPQNKPDRQHQGELNITHIRSVVNQPSSKNLGKASLFIFFLFWFYRQVWDVCPLQGSGFMPSTDPCFTREIRFTKPWPENPLPL